MMIYAAIALLLAAATLCTRIGRLKLAILLLKIANGLADAGGRIIVREEERRS